MRLGVALLAAGSSRRFGEADKLAQPLGDELLGVRAAKAIPLDRFGSFVAGIPAPLGIGQVETETGDWVQGFVCESYAVADAEDITGIGSWRKYLASKGL